MTRNELIEALTKAEAGSRELDAEIFLAVHPEAYHYQWYQARDGESMLVTSPGPLGKVFDHPRLTTSLDAALALVEKVLPGWDFTVTFWADGTSDVSGEKRDPLKPSYECIKDVVGRPPVLALCIALLRALKGE